MLLLIQLGTQHASYEGFTKLCVWWKNNKDSMTAVSLFAFVPDETFYLEAKAKADLLLLEVEAAVGVSATKIEMLRHTLNNSESSIISVVGHCNGKPTIILNGEEVNPAGKKRWIQGVHNRLVAVGKKIETSIQL